MRVLLVYPNLDSPVGVNHGLSIISGVLKAAGHETRLVHVNEKLFDVPTGDELVARVREWGAGLVGFSLMTQQVPWAVEAARALRAALPEVPLVAGGVHCTMVPDEVVAAGEFDVVAVGEAELAFRELVDRIERGEDPTTIPNLRFPARSRYNAGPAPISNPVGPFPDLAALPDNDYELFDMRRITRAKNGWIGVLTSRGCPYKCTYCFNKEIVDRYKADGAATTGKEYLRHYPVERIIGELEGLKARHSGIDTLLFDDDLFTLDRDYVRDFCRAYKASGLGLPFVVNAHVQVFDEDMAFTLADAGCRIVKFGLESGSKRLRTQVLWRFMSNERIKAAFAAAHHYGLHTSAFVMFGLPTETREDLLETLQLIADTEMGRFRWAMFFPFPGTAGHRIASERGLIDPDAMKGAGNYFEGTCLRWDADTGLFLQKLGRVAHWWVNALSAWPCAPLYRELVAEVDAWDAAEWAAKRADLRRRDRELSERLIAEGVRHYSLRYTHVMGVDSDFVIRERARLRDAPQYVPVGYTLDD
ncbi:MAG: B12-binding domain-containing radical SAM protein [Planctomycetes bacterium]|nr:B12-binding domain-containing radical SAM protein [Planctomycetota bacterium]